MDVVYTHHLKFRLKIRNIPYDLAKKIFKQAKEHYYDSQTKHYVAVGRVRLKGKLRDMALTYDKEEGFIELVTLHPIKPYQKYSRVTSGRWKKI